MLKASRLPRRKDSGGAGTETSTVPFPYQKAKGGSLPRIWVAPRSLALSSQRYWDESVFFLLPRGVFPYRARGRYLWRKDTFPLDPHRKHGGNRDKRRQRRIKRPDFEETARLAARKGRES